MAIEIVPVLYQGGLLNPNAAGSAIQRAMNQAAQLIKQDWESHTRNYSGGTEPVFDQVTQYEYNIGDNDERVVRNVQGVRPHVIRARAGGVLAFQTNGFSPKTRVRVIPSTAGSRPGGAFVYARQVNHPGVQARETDEAIVEKEQPVVERMILQALIRAIE